MSTPLRVFVRAHKDPVLVYVKRPNILRRLTLRLRHTR